jgi:hypothetical protein
MQRRFQRETEAGTRKAALEEVRRLFERYRSHARAAVERAPTRRTEVAQGGAEVRVERPAQITP